MATRRAQPEIVPDEDGPPAPKARNRKPTSAPASTSAAAPAAPKAPRAPRAPKAADDGATKTRRAMGGRNWLAREIDRVLREANGPVTVHEIVIQITNKFGEHPSSGAVAAALKRWSEQGYININPKPLAFKAFPAKYRDAGSLDTFLERTRESRLTARRAVRAA